MKKVLIAVLLLVFVGGCAVHYKTEFSAGAGKTGTRDAAVMSTGKHKPQRPARD